MNIYEFNQRKPNMKKIIVFGLGYVGLSNAITLAQNNEVVGIDVDEKKINLINQKISPIVDKEISDYLANKKLNFVANRQDDSAIKNADFVIISTPTNFNEEKNIFDTTSIESVIDNVIKTNSNATIVIKSTIPIGYMNRICQIYPNIDFLFSPEFLREGKALLDNLYPSRIIVGYEKTIAKLKNKAMEFANLLLEGTVEKKCPILLMGYKEAESVKLFANTYLAMRVAYINELDNFALEYDLSSKDIILGICSDPRIGNFYNNPSFGYGGYCFPKDTKQLYANFKGIPNELIRATVYSNKIRKKYLSDYVIDHTNSSDTIGIYRLIMKSGSDNCRSSAIFDIIKLISKKRNIIIYEPTISSFENCTIVNNLQEFKTKSNLIIANRLDKNLEDVKNKTFTRDLFNRD